MTRSLYTLLMWLAQPLLRRKLARRGLQEPLYLQAVEERFGHYSGMRPPADGHTVWVHAVSLGETRAAALLVARLRERLPGMRLLLTHGTATGRAEGARLLQEGDLQSWNPWDTPAAVAHFLDHFRPRMGILMETEIWPNLAAACARSGVPLVLANARMSEKTWRLTQRLAWLARPAYRSLAAVWAQTQDDAVRLASLGASVQGVFGNIKFDANPDSAQLVRGRAWHDRAGRPVLMFASSRDGEENTLLRLLASCRSDVPVNSSQPTADSAVNRVQWLIVPRHPQRFDEVASLIEQHGFPVSRRSRWLDGPPAASEAMGAHQSIWLGDSLGEMALYYSLSDVALLGGSFEPLGGQNLIEAAACACPVVMGPHTFNFRQAAELAEAAGAALRVADLAQALLTALALVQDRSRLQAARHAADAFASAPRGATGRLVNAIVQLLDSRKP
jgi:3-deoxy-D-manno-octulosonic-acid transferase